MSRIVVHATSLSLFVASRWRGVLVLGPSGIGKSDLALRAIHSGFSLVSDDYTTLWSSGGHLYGAPPDSITGKLEIRGIGIVGERIRPMTRIDLCALCQSDTPERLPEAEVTTILGHDIATIRLNPREASSLTKLLTRLRAG